MTRSRLWMLPKSNSTPSFKLRQAVRCRAITNNYLCNWHQSDRLGKTMESAKSEFNQSYIVVQFQELVKPYGVKTTAS